MSKATAVLVSECANVLYCGHHSDPRQCVYHSLVISMCSLLSTGVKPPYTWMAALSFYAIGLQK